MILLWYNTKMKSIEEEIVELATCQTWLRDDHYWKGELTGQIRGEDAHDHVTEIILFFNMLPTYAASTLNRAMEDGDMKSATEIHEWVTRVLKANRLKVIELAGEDWKNFCEQIGRG